MKIHCFAISDLVDNKNQINDLQYNVNDKNLSFNYDIL